MSIPSIDECIRLNSPTGALPDLIRLHCESVHEALLQSPWGSLSESLILNDVFPFTALREPPISSESIYRKLRAHVWNILTNAPLCQRVDCVVERLNTYVWDITTPPIVFEAAAPNQLNSYSVEETLERRNSSCTGLSVFLVTALRMAGVPARIAGVPHWNLGPSACPLGDASPSCGNHNWVEVYIPNTGWSFVDQRRPDLQVLPLNTSWFYPDHIQGNTAPYNGNHSVYSVSFRDPDELGDDYPTGVGVSPADHFPMVWDWDDRTVYAWDVSASYTVADDSFNVYTG
jgi:hypothetical protein